MATIKINGCPLPSPKRGMDIKVITVVDAGRNVNGEIVGQKIGRDQYKIDGLEWSWLTAEEWSDILNLMTDFYFPVTFCDPVSCHDITITMYCGDRSAKPYLLDANDNPRIFRECKVNLIDTGR